jgi:hypothetical protein
MGTFLKYVLLGMLLGAAVCLWWVTSDRCTTAYKAEVKKVQTYQQEKKAIIDEIAKIK